MKLLKLGPVDARTLSKNTNVPRPEIYRTLNELQRMGLVEKEIARPYKFSPTPPQCGLQIMMLKRLKHFKETQEETKRFLRKIQNYQEEKPKKKEYKFIIIEGRDRIIQRMKCQHDNAQRSIDILSTFQRWLYILSCCFEDYEKALQRGVKYRVVIEKPENKNVFREYVKAVMAEPTFELRLSRFPLQTNSAVFDKKEATFNFYPPKFLTESPIIWTNHPSFISMCQDHFEKIWNVSSPTKLRVQT